MFYKISWISTSEVQDIRLPGVDSSLSFVVFWFVVRVGPCDYLYLFCVGDK